MKYLIKGLKIILILAILIQEDLPNDTLIVLEDIGHTPMEENPVESLEAVIDFLIN